MLVKAITFLASVSLLGLQVASQVYCHNGCCASSTGSFACSSGGSSSSISTGGSGPNPGYTFPDTTGCICTHDKTTNKYSCQSSSQTVVYGESGSPTFCDPTTNVAANSVCSCLVSLNADQNAIMQQHSELVVNMELDTIGGLSYGCGTLIVSPTSTAALNGAVPDVAGAAVDGIPANCVLLSTRAISSSTNSSSDTSSHDTQHSHATLTIFGVPQLMLTIFLFFLLQ